MAAESHNSTDITADDSHSMRDDECSLLDEQLWYDNDLLLAAELGKTLLERNRDLDNRLSLSEARNEELELEIELLLKQVDALRELNESKMSVYEEVDRHSQDVDKQNEKLKREVSQEKEKYEMLLKSKHSLEIQSEEWRTYAEGLEKKVKELQGKVHDIADGEVNCKVPCLPGLTTPDRRGRRATSVPNVCDDQSSSDSYNPSNVKSFWPPPGAADWDCATPVNYRLRILGLTAELRTERQHSRNLAEEIDQLVNDNKSLKDDLKTCAESLRQLQIDREDIHSVDEGTRSHDVVTPTPVAPTFDFENTLNGANWEVELYSEVEHDYPLGFTSDEVQRHSSGAQIYSPLLQNNYNAYKENYNDNHEREALYELSMRYENLSREYEAFLQQREGQKRCNKRVGDSSHAHECGENQTEDNWQDDGPGLPSFSTASELRPLAYATNSLQVSMTSSTMSLTPSLLFQQKLDNIFCEESRRMRKGMMTEDYKPKYKELFRDAFDLLHQMKEASQNKTNKATSTNDPPTNGKKKRNKKRRRRHGNGNNTNNNSNATTTTTTMSNNCSALPTNSNTSYNIKNNS